ncbi:hypothetical protein APICC_09220 [Apis cerana cerana]|uniref:Transmembrane protein n=1 Tax=Apis cerana cerana TaxID=94128 RepID=A0A2A3EIU5_APICC|nr:hypothetical protein APICC_09220 [Apis cerana cerana]
MGENRVAEKCGEAGGGRYRCYLDGNNVNNSAHRRYGSVPFEEHRSTYNQGSRYEYIEDEERSHVQRRGSLRYEFIPRQQVQQRSAPAANQDDGQMPSCRNNGGRYAVVPGDQDYQDEEAPWNTVKRVPSARRHINTPQGRYSRVPLQEEEPPALPERNGQELSTSPKNNLATQKLHEILATPRKPPRSRSEERTLSPKRQHSFNQTGTPQRRALTPGGSPTAPVDLVTMGHGDPPPRYAYMENGLESMPMVSGSPRYQVIPAGQKRNGYQSVESAFIARTAVVPPLSPPNSDANTTLASGLEKNDRRNAPFLLVLVGILTCGLALYLSWTQGRRYYYDSAAGCGACCALAGACRTLRKTWTGLGLAGLSALSCAGLLLLAAKSPKPGTPLHDVTAGALCGVSLLGAVLALLALLSPRCNLGRHRRVHSWIPRLSP